MCSMMLFLLIPAISAFPLTGGNGIENATVYGTYKQSRGTGDAILLSEGQEIITLDMAIPWYPNLRDASKVILVDQDDIFHGISALGQLDTAEKRWHLSFEIPKDTVIKYVRIDPPTSNPFIIEWTGVPEAVGKNIATKFYGFSSEFTANSGSGKWFFDVKVTNTNNSVTTINVNCDFVVIDQFGSTYHSPCSKENPSSNYVVNLLPGESARFTVYFRAVSTLSRPVYLVYRPEDMRMDVSAWA